MVAGRASYSLSELTEKVARSLQERGLTSVQHDQRVSAAPDKRTIRYYTTLGILDRPEIKGRQAFYNDRHVLQLLAIKSLQGVALPLSEIQSLLLGSTDGELEHVINNVAESVRVQERLKKKEALEPKEWLEIQIEPGLKIMAERGWESGLDDSLLLNRVKAALDVMRAAAIRPDRPQ